MFDAGLWPRPQFLQTLVSPGLDARCLPFLLVGSGLPAMVMIALVFLAGVEGFRFSSKSMTTSENVFAWVILRPDLD